MSGGGENNGSSKHTTWLSTLRNKLLFALSVYFLITGLLIGGILWYNQQRDELHALEQDVEFLNQGIKEIDLVAKNFFSYEVINPEFYESGGRSQYIFEQKYLLNELNDRLTKIQKHFPGSDSLIDGKISELRQKLYAYNASFDLTTETIIQRGFKDYGKEGEMRDNIHFIENSQAGLPLELVLTLRRHEKDFILRKESKYIEEFEVAWLKLLKAINKAAIEEEDKSELIVNLNTYHKNFLDLVQLEKKLGFNVLSGLRGDLVFSLSTIQKDIKDISVAITDFSDNLRQQSTTVLTFIFIICIVIITLLAVLIVNRLGKPINELSNSIHKVIRSNFDEKVKIYHFDSDDEIGRLSSDFIFMVDTVRRNTKEILDQKKSLEEYSIQLEQQNEEITQQANSLINANSAITEKNIHITEQKERLERQRDELEKAQKTIEKQNKKLIEINVNLESEVKKRAGELQEAYQELLKAHTQLDQFTYRSSHDLKGPIATLLGLCVVGRLELHDNPKALNIIDRLESRAREMEKVLSRLIFSLDIKHKEVELNPINLPELQQKIYQEFEDLENFDILFNVNGKAELFSDSYLLQTVLENMVENSYQYRNPHRQENFIKIDWKELSHDQIEIRITDNGLGIPMETSEYIFDMFFKASNISKGSGLGLYIVKVIIEKLGGQIRLLNSDELLTVFEIILPKKKESASESKIASDKFLKEQLF